MAPDANRFDWIRPVCRGGQLHPPPEMEAELDAAEKLLGSLLPAGYRAFAQRFGLGGRLHSLPELFPLMPPSGKQDRHWSDSVIDSTQFWRSPAAVENGLPAEFLQQAIVFGCDEGELTFLFYTGDVTDPAAPEYRIYQIPRHEGPEAICESFEAWLRWVHKQYDPAAREGNDDGVSSDPGRSVDSLMPYARFSV
jgi:hypothetical protein